MTTREQHHDPSPLESHAAHALQELLVGRLPSERDTGPLTGDVKACVDALTEALRADGVQAVRSAFTALSKDRSWLVKLASLAPAGPADEQVPERRVRFVPDDDFENRPPREWLISKLIPRSGVSLVYGLPRSGKSFLTMAWSLCIATGTPWLGRAVVRGPVAYIAAEGGSGLGPRLKAWKTYHGSTGRSGVQWFDKPLVLAESGQFSELVTAIKEDFPEPPVLVVIDTFSRCSGGADENSAAEIARFIAAADALQEQFQCSVLIVHHLGKDIGRGPRGSSAMMGNTETVICVTATTQGCLVTCAKQKDAKEFSPISLKMQVVRYGPGEEDESVVLVAGDERAEPLRPDSHSTVLACLAGKQLSYQDLEQACLAAGQKESTFKKAFKALREGQNIVKVGRLWQLSSGRDERRAELEEDDPGVFEEIDGLA